jgi:alkylated DNA repair dioxygenase AlkB
MRGVVARRRVKFYGRSYDAVPGPEEPIPEFLFPLRDRLAAWAKIDPPAFAMALINEYQESAPIGWHRDAPQYELIAGVSLLSLSRMKLRPYVAPKDVSKVAGPRKTTHEIELKPRSAYLITGEARAGYEHSIPPVTSLRYSITFRTLRRAG